MAILDRDNWDRIAGMLAVGVPQEQIAEAVGMSQGRISQLRDDPDFQKILQGKLAERLQEVTDINTGWDDIEREAVKTIRKKLNSGFDPDYALRAAMVANRAARKGMNGNVPLPAQMGDRVVLNLSQTFVGKLQHLAVAGESIKDIKSLGDILGQKKVNLMAPQQVKSLLLNEVEGNTSISDPEMGEIELV